jgi:hypothetical protein
MPTSRPRGAVRCAIPLALLIAALMPASAGAAGNWTCEASAVHGTVLTNLQLDPLAANRGQPACQPATAGISTPSGLPLPISLDALYARTSVDGPAGAQVAGAEAGVADLKVGSVPSLPLPAPDLGVTQVPLSVPLLGTITVDLRPALEALQEPVPNANLLHVQAAQASASAQCVNGSPQLTGSSTIAGLAIGGRSFAVDQPITETVALIDTRSIDPSDIDLAKVVLPLGVNLSAVQGVLKKALDSLPTIDVPPTLAQVTVTPKRQIRTGSQLTQHALDAYVSVAGVPVADLVVGEATVGSGGVDCAARSNDNPPNGDNPPHGSPPTVIGSGPPGGSGGSSGPGAGTVDQALACTSRSLALIDVVVHGGRVRLVGAADRRFAGRRVAIKLTGTGKTVARAKVADSGLFRATVPLPPRAIRNSNRARYQATIGKEESLPLKLARRVLVLGTRVAGGKVTLTGRLIRPLPARLRPITVKRRVSCDDWKTVGRARPAANGSFRVTVDGPPDGQVAVYRLQTQVAASWTRRARLSPTFSLPRFVEG